MHFCGEGNSEQNNIMVVDRTKILGYPLVDLITYKIKRHGRPGLQLLTHPLLSGTQSSWGIFFSPLSPLQNPLR